MKKLLAGLGSMLTVVAMVAAFTVVPARVDARPNVCKYVSTSLQCTADCHEGPDCPCVVGQCHA